MIDDLPLFSSVSSETAPKHSMQGDLEKALDKIYPDDLSPKEALQIVYDLKKLSQKDSGA